MFQNSVSLPSFNRFWWGFQEKSQISYIFDKCNNNFELGKSWKVAPVPVERISQREEEEQVEKPLNRKKKQSISSEMHSSISLDSNVLSVFL